MVKGLPDSLDQQVRAAYGEQGPLLGVTMAELEDVALILQRAVLDDWARGVTAVPKARLPQSQLCPDCGRECQGADSARRDSQMRAEEFELHGPECYCSACRRAFSPSAHSIAR